MSKLSDVHIFCRGKEEKGEESEDRRRGVVAICRYLWIAWCLLFCYSIFMLFCDVLPAVNAWRGTDSSVCRRRLLKGRERRWVSL